MPWWPDDLPDFNGPWLAYGLRHNHAIAEAVYPDVAALMDGNEHVEYLAVWRRGGVDSMYLQLGHGAHVRQVFPDCILSSWVVRRRHFFWTVSALVLDGVVGLGFLRFCWFGYFMSECVLR